MHYAKVSHRKPKWEVRVNDLKATDAIRVTCFCGGGPWLISTHWLYAREHPLGRIVDVIKARRCPKCGTGDVLVWDWVRASRKEGDAPPPPPIRSPFGALAEDD